MSSKRDLLRSALNDRYLSMEDMDTPIDDGDTEDLDLMDEDSASEEVDQLHALSELKEVNDMAMESTSDPFSVACMLAAALESHGVPIHADPSNRAAFPADVNAALEGALADYGNRLRTRWQNFKGFFGNNKKGLEFIRNNTKLIEAAVSNEPINAFVTKGVARNVAIGSKFDESTLRGIDQSIKVMDRVSAYLAGEVQTCKKIAALAGSGTALSGSEVADILKGHLVREKLPELKTTVFPGNRVFTNVRGSLPEWTPISGTGITWTMSAADGSNAFFGDELSKTKVQTGRVVISPRAQQQILTLSKRLEGSYNLAAAGYNDMHDSMNRIIDLFHNWDTGVTEQNAFTRQGGLLRQYMDSLLQISIFIYLRTKFTSLGLRQLMTIR